MPPRRELCKNFQRGSCRYGANCKFMHVNQQQPKPNTSGFGSQTGVPFQQTSSQQQMPNPYGFGVQNSGPASGSGGFAQPNGFKPFENKWVRSQQTGNQSQSAQSQAGNHNCTDPNVCKQQIAEDFNHERPLWKLTCYGHYKNLPCDITGDISFEELRAEAYTDAKRGLSLQLIVEREKNLEKSKLLEFENLLRNPYSKNGHIPHSNNSPFPVAGTTLPSVTQSTSPSPCGSSNTQQGPASNMTFGVRPSTPSNNAFGQFQSSGTFGSNGGPSGGNPFSSSRAGFGNGTITSQGNQPSMQTGGSPISSNLTSFGNGAMNSQGNQVPVQTGVNPFTSNMSPFSNSGMVSQGSQPSSSFPVSPQPSQIPSISQPPVNSNTLSSTNPVEQRNKDQFDISSPVDSSIWLKEEWKLGEIPEQPPPAAYVK